jgi:hypothetical protein
VCFVVFIGTIPPITQQMGLGPVSHVDFTTAFIAERFDYDYFRPSDEFLDFHVYYVADKMIENQKIFAT